MVGPKSRLVILKQTEQNKKQKKPNRLSLSLYTFEAGVAVVTGWHVWYLQPTLPPFPFSQIAALFCDHYTHPSQTNTNLSLSLSNKHYSLSNGHKQHIILSLTRTHTHKRTHTQTYSFLFLLSVCVCVGLNVRILWMNGRVSYRVWFTDSLIFLLCHWPDLTDHHECRWCCHQSIGLYLSWWAQVYMYLPSLLSPFTLNFSGHLLFICNQLRCFCIACVSIGISHFY